MRPLAFGVLLLAVAFAWRPAAQSRVAEPYAGVLDEHPLIAYRLKPTRDRVAQLKSSVDSGSRSLDSRGPAGYLQSVLDALDIAPESQVLVFSKTGIQRAVTGPQTPRALYFNDSVVVGYIAGAPFLELAAQDPEQGVVFYTIDQTRPTIARRANCLTCHVSNNTMDVPGMIARSMFTSRDGDVLPQLGSHLVDHRTPLAHRWGRWFVTGSYPSPPYGGIGHMGNVTTTFHPTSGPAGTSNEVFIEWLNSAPETRGYASSASDIVALMTFDHQMHAMNLLTRLNWETRIAAAEQPGRFTAGPLAQLVEQIVDYVLFVDEVPPPARLTPRPGFVERFVAAAPKDRRGRSLRDLDLERRLLRHPCSYTIDSAAFASLPAPAKQAVYARIAAVLSGRDSRPKYAHLSSADRTAIVEILRDTHPQFAAY